MNHPSDILLGIGRFHVLFVHLPIGMILLLALLEVAAWFPRFQKANASAGFILAIAAPLAVVTAGCGWLLSLGGGYDAKLLFWHEWLGITTALGALVTAILYRCGKRFAYHLSLFVTAGVLGAAGHLGGSLTHGSDYLTHYAPAFVKKLLGAAPEKNSAGTVATASDNSAFANCILPVLKNNCVSCHGPQKSKGGLRLDSYAALMQGGDDGPAIKPGDAAHSDLLQRLAIPAEDDDHMPPAGKPQPTPEEITLLKWWVDAGASATKTIAELQPSADILKAINAAR